MSWLIGIIGKSKGKYINNIKDIVKDKAIVDNDLAAIFAGGYNNTFLTVDSIQSEMKIIVNGVGLLFDDFQYKLMGAKEWIEIASTNNLSKVNGHYVIAFIYNNKLTIRTDLYGLRELYYTCLDEQTYLFSTRIDWLLSIKSTELEFSKVGSKWLLSNAINDNTPFKGVYKLNKGKYIEYNSSENSLIIKELAQQPWENIDGFETTLKKITNIQLPKDLQKTFLLSGRLDSRMLLSLFSEESLQLTKFYTFGSNKSIDVIIAKKSLRI